MTASIEEVSGKTFDYIIIGGGTAGLTAAAKLTEDPSISVLVLESGPANLNDPALLRSASYGSQFGKDQYTWNHRTIPQKHLNNRLASWQRGRGLGGSSGVNFLNYIKPPARDLNDWEKLGNKGWNWESFQTIISGIEGFAVPSKEYQEKYGIECDDWAVGRDGPLVFGFPGYIDPTELAFQETLSNAGIPRAPNPYGGDPAGYYFGLNTYDPSSHSRTYATTAFYLPNRDRSNLTVLVTAHVHKVLTEHEPSGKLKAVGVVFGHKEKTFEARVRREVVLSAGALKTPQLLELSGIGRKDVLEKICVPLKLDLAGVGENVQEHMMAVTSWELKDDVDALTLDILRDPEGMKKHLELLKQGKGVFTTGVVNFTYATLDMFSQKADAIHDKLMRTLSETDVSNLPPGLLEQRLLQADRYRPGSGSPCVEYIFFPGFLSVPNPPRPGQRHLSVTTVMNNNLSRGTIHCKSDNANEDPEYDGNYIDCDVDLEVYVEALKFVRTLANVPPFRDLIAREVNPGAEVNDDASLAEWLRNSLGTTWHTIGSCSMLPREKQGVVDTNLKVYGTSNLRIADVSVVPLQVASHTQSLAYAIGVKVAENIKAGSS